MEWEMVMKLMPAAVMAAALVAGAARAQAPAGLPPAAVSLAASPAIDQWNVFGTGESHRVMADATVAGGYAFAVKVAGAGQNPWDVQAGVITVLPIHAGDTVLLALWARPLAQPPGASAIAIHADIQQAQAPYTPIAGQDLSVSGGWKLYYVSGVSSLDLQAGEAAATVQLATGQQEIALGPVFVLDFGQGYDLARLPVN